MLDFTSALYLGFGHPSAALRPWARLTTGTPAALGVPPESTAVAAALAELLGCERAALAPSTLHVYWDLFPLLAGAEDAIYVDDAAYPIARWGVERVVGRGVRARTFPHRDAAALQRLVRREGRRPIVVTDGLCPDCGLLPPLPAYIDAVRSREGQVVVDDTQALGLLGPARGPGAPYGRGGSGSVRLFGSPGREVIVVASLAKALGVPIAMLAGNAQLVDRYETQGDTRAHCSPPSVAVLRAAERALALNALHGDALRSLLASLVRRFRRGVANLGLTASGGSFPFQTIATDAHARLLEQGVRTVQRRNGVTFLITALHRASEIDRAVRALDIATRRGTGGRESGIR